MKILIKFELVSVKISGDFYQIMIHDDLDYAHKLQLKIYK